MGEMRQGQAGNDPIPCRPGVHLNRRYSMPDHSHWILRTPAFVYDEAYILRQAGLLDQLRKSVGLKLLFSIKSLPFLPVLELLRPWVDGYAVSSLFEARLAGEVCGGENHITTPGLRQEEIAEISRLCRYVAFNSLEQFARLTELMAPASSPGLRINPGASFLADDRFDPCRKHSKLGVPVDDLHMALERDRGLAGRLEGLHLHNNFRSQSFSPLLRMLNTLEESLAPLFFRLKWINLGGGYLFEQAEDLEELATLVARLRKEFGLEVFFEPGSAFVGAAGYLVATVVDAFVRDGKPVAVLDTSVNHHPEVFEYQRKAEIAGFEPEHGTAVLLAGSTCLAGDLFGEFRFARLPRPGDTVAFRNVGAYSLIKASRFNGYPLPSIYARDTCGNLRLMKLDNYQNYARQWSAEHVQDLSDG
jgi:carboxynorspermidine decarboxylase